MITANTILEYIQDIISEDNKEFALQGLSNFLKDYLIYSISAPSIRELYPHLAVEDSQKLLQEVENILRFTSTKDIVLDNLYNTVRNEY